MMLPDVMRALGPSAKVIACASTPATGGLPRGAPGQLSYRAAASTLCLAVPFGIGLKSLFFVTLARNDVPGPREQELKRPVSIFH